MQRTKDVYMYTVRKKMYFLIFSPPLYSSFEVIVETLIFTNRCKEEI